MKLHVSFRHVTNSPAVVERIDARARRLSDRFDPAAELRAVCDLDGGGALVEVSGYVGGRHHIATGRSHDMYRAVDEAFDALASRIARAHDRSATQRRRRPGVGALSAA